MTIIESIKNEIHRRGLTTYQAAALVSDIVSQRHFYHWISGKHHLSDDKASAVLTRFRILLFSMREEELAAQIKPHP